MSAVSSPAPNEPPRLLALDAGTPQTVVVVGDPRAAAPAGSFAHVARRGEAPASERVSEWIEAALAEVGWPASSITALAVGRGPGTFTGARVGVGTAKGLAIGLGLALHPVSTLAAVAADAGTSAPLRPGDEVLAVLDARKGEVYAGYFSQTERGLRPVADERVGTPQQVWGRVDLDRLCAVVGTGLAPHRASFETLAGAAAGRLRWLPTLGVTPGGLWSGARAALDSTPIEASSLDVTYLRQSYAELGIHPPKRKYPPNPFV